MEEIKKIDNPTFSVKCNQCKSTMTFIDLGGTWAGSLSFKHKENILTLQCTCGNKIRII